MKLHIYYIEITSQLPCTYIYIYTSIVSVHFSEYYGNFDFKNRQTCN